MFWIQTWTHIVGLNFQWSLSFCPPKYENFKEQQNLWANWFFLPSKLPNWMPTEISLLTFSLLNHLAKKTVWLHLHYKMYGSHPHHKQTTKFPFLRHANMSSFMRWFTAESSLTMKWAHVLYTTGCGRISKHLCHAVHPCTCNTRQNLNPISFHSQCPAKVSQYVLTISVHQQPLI